MKYIIKSWDEILSLGSLDSEGDIRFPYGTHYFTKHMCEYCGDVIEVDDLNDDNIIYNGYYIHRDMLKPYMNRNGANK